jgi:DNA-binding Lrp family transcriptional regulator
VAVSGWILVQAGIGSARVVADTFATFTAKGIRILSADTVTGPHDVIVHLEADSLDQLGAAVETALAGVSGVQNTFTCLTINR